MNLLASHIDVNSPTFTENNISMERLVVELQEKLLLVKKGGSAAKQKHQQSKGKLPVRERVLRLLDPDSEFMEFSPLAALNVYADDTPAAGLVTGIGKVHGREIIIIANDPTVKGGTYYPLTVKKHLRAQEVARENHLPCVYLVDSGGAFLPRQDEVFPDRDHFGRIFFNQAQMSAQGIAQIAVVLGSCTAGGAYVPALSDEVIIVKHQGTIFLGGPPLVQAATGERVSAEELGGAEVHTRLSGVADYLAENDTEALQLARNIVKTLSDNGITPHSPIENSEPRYAIKECYGIIPADPRLQYNVREIIARIVDCSEMLEFKPLYGQTLVCGFARIGGYSVGIIANNGILFSESALKGTHFIQLCNQRGLPMVFLQNIAGFMVGRDYEHAGIAKDGAKMVNALACSKVAKFTVIIGGSFGAGNYAMCGRAFGPRQLWMWPNARISVMGGENAATVLSLVKRESRKRLGEVWSEKAEQTFRRDIQDQYERQGSPYYSTARLWDDGVIDPVDTRRLLIMGIATARNTTLAGGGYGVFRM